ncbi:unnamed protein product [Didymodactylos carnosus]|uniref:Uncharacterized protein n=1 Tax=Didymodactylos carnosus TaxID=1234261 RepID=A0A8S2E7N5_9BILA|nr:unnamed protein product [Didymodactylos carnosus]CAF3964245.1 unnamed protein product [Didymodactylos carnosus]
MVFHVLPSDGVNYSQILYELSLYEVIPSFDDQPTDAIVDQKIALSLWIQLLCLFNNDQEETVDNVTQSELCFEHSINQALEGEKFDEILKCRSLMRNLYSYLYAKWFLQHAPSISDAVDTTTTIDETTILTVYYVQNNLMDQLNFFKTNVGRKLMINKFLLTNKNKNLAMCDNVDMSGMRSVLFEITIDTKLQTKPYVKVRDQTVVIIATCAIYDLKSVTFENENKIWQVQLVLSKQDDSDVSNYLNLFSQNQEHNYEYYIIGSTLCLLKQYELAVKFFIEKLKFYSITIHYVNILQSLSYAAFRASGVNDNPLFSLFIVWLTLRLLKRLPKAESTNNISMRIYLVLGYIYRRRRLFSQALYCYKKAQEKIKPDMYYTILISLSIGHICEMKNELFRAHSYYRAVFNLMVDQIKLPNHHSVVETVVKNIGRIEYKLYLYYLKRVQDRYENRNHFTVQCTSDVRLLPTVSELDGPPTEYKHLYRLLVKYYFHSKTFNYTTVAKIYSTIANHQICRGSVAEAISSQKNALNVRLKYLSLSTSDVMSCIELAMDCYSLATYYYLQYNYHQSVPEHKRYLQLADIYVKKAIRIQLKCLPNDHILLGESYNLQAIIHVGHGQYNLALIYFSQVISIFWKWMSYDHEKLGIIYKSIGSVYLRKIHYQKAIDYLQIALEYCKKGTYLKYYHINQIYKLLTIAYYRLKNNEKAIETMKIVVNSYSEYRLSSTNPMVDVLKLSIENERQYNFDELYQQIHHIIEMNNERIMYEVKYDYEYLLLRSLTINIEKFYICMYDEYLSTHIDVYYLSVVNDENSSDASIIDKLRQYCKQLFYIYYKVFDNKVELLHYIHLINQNYSGRNQVLIVSSKIKEAISQQQSQQQHPTQMTILTIDQNSTDLAVDMVWEIIQFQLRTFKSILTSNILDRYTSSNNGNKPHKRGEVLEQSAKYFKFD